MDSRFELFDLPRELPAGLSADLPVVTIAWRAMQREYQRLEAKRRREADEARAIEAAFVALADELFRLDKAGCAEPVRSMRATLATVGVAVPQPEGENFIEPWIDLFENIATVPKAGIEAACIAEVVLPAVLRYGVLLRRGKVVIALPVNEDEQKNDGGSERPEPNALFSDKSPTQP